LKSKEEAAKDILKKIAGKIKQITSK
jgi:hypothetical protein